MAVPAKARERAVSINLSQERRGWILAHCHEPGFSIGQAATALNVPPFAVQTWLSRPDLAAEMRRRQTHALASALAEQRGEAPAANQETPAMRTPEPAPESVPLAGYPGVRVQEDAPHVAILTPDLKAALVAKVRAIAGEAAREMGRESVRTVLKDELRELVIVTVREAFRELLDALEPLATRKEA